MITKVLSATCIGVNAALIEIEVDVSNGMPNFQIVGLPDAGVKESRERIRAAIKNSGFRFPPEKITVNLAPADLKKEGAAFDLPIAIGILASSGLLEPEMLKDYVIAGELALDGTLRPIPGALVLSSDLKTQGAFILPKPSASEAALEKSATVYGARSLEELVKFLKGGLKLEAEPFTDEIKTLTQTNTKNFADIRGQRFAKRALEIAVAGGHNALLIGSPGSGKTMLASRVPSILPPLQFDEALEITKIHSLKKAFQTKNFLVTERPFRAPHHTASAVALTGGGTWPKPGEITLSHGGVLFLDEFPEFRRDVLEALRGPLEDGRITISRVKSQLTFPARSLLVAAMNPCPCGYLSDPKRACRCSSIQINRYQSKVSGPILDRIDLHIEVAPVSIKSLTEDSNEESSELIRERVIECRRIQRKRFRAEPFKLNAGMEAKEIKKFAYPTTEGENLLKQAIKELHLSARAYFKILKVARTIADLAGDKEIQEPHIAEAIEYRSLDRQW